MKIRTTSLSLFLLFWAPAFAQKWPTQIIPRDRLGVYQVKAEEGAFLYETASYRIQSPKKIDSDLVRNFVISAESVAFALKSIPLPLFSPPHRIKPLIRIELDEESYAAAGGPKGSAGFYDGRSNIVVVRWDQLKQSPRPSRLIRRPAFDLLVHELTHLGMREQIWKIEPWLTEGVAEYLAAAHLKQGRFNFRDIEAQIRDHIRRQNGLSGPSINATTLQVLVDLSYRDWLKRIAILPPKQALESYTSSLLLTHFYFHGGSERRHEMKQYLTRLQKITSPRERGPLLVSSTEASEIEKKIKAYWSSRGLQLHFR